MRKLVAVALLASSIGTAHAWGAREQGALAGVVGTLILQQSYRQPVLVQQPGMVYSDPRFVQAPGYQPQPPVYVPQARQLQCWQAPVRDYSGAITHYVTQCF